MSDPTLTPVQLNLTKTLDDPADYVLLGEQLKVVDEHFDKDSTQHKARRWEYAMCLRTYLEWRHAHPALGRLTEAAGGRLVAADVGGAGSPLWRMLTDVGLKVNVIDPKLPKADKPTTVESFAHRLGSDHVSQAFDVVTCISVIEHVEDRHFSNFLDALAAVTAPGGLLFLTMDCWGKDPSERDTAMFHWMRERIYTQKSWQDLSKGMVKRGFHLFGMPDWEYHGNHVENAYSFCSLCLQKGS